MKPAEPKDWPFIEAGLLGVLRKTGEPWSVAHVKQAYYEGRAAIFVSDDSVVVVQKQRADWTAEPYLQVWVMWSRPWAADEKEDEYIAWLDQLTREHGCVYWEWGGREGWKRLKGKCERVTTIWRRRIT